MTISRQRHQRGLGPLRALATCLAAVAFVVSSCGGDSSRVGGTLRVSAAASLQAAFTAYGEKFTDADAKFSFAGSDALAAQIRAGVKPDVFASANTSLPDALYVEGRVEKPIRFASNELVLAKPTGSHKVNSLADLMRPGIRIAIGADSVPVGAYTFTVLNRLPPSQRKAIFANVRTKEPDVTGIVGKLTQGAVDAGFVYATDVRAAKGRLDTIELPSSLQPVVAYEVALVKGAPNPEAGKAFIYGLLSGAGRDALDAAGFGSPPPT